MGSVEVFHYPKDDFANLNLSPHTKLAGYVSNQWEMASGLSFFKSHFPLSW
jgi:hypothetical protein